MNDLTEAEQKNVRAALQFLRIRFGSLRAMSMAFRFKPKSLQGILSGHDNVSPIMVFRVARLVGIGLDDLLAGKYPVKGACPHCGRLPSASDPIVL